MISPVDEAENCIMKTIRRFYRQWICSHALLTESISRDGACRPVMVRVKPGDFSRMNSQLAIAFY
ncbi:MAG TPA: hypothetical protein ENJ60_13050 [Aeromonadales bacterium]|nr:hypothetical protein [Aeromonadales bacterium]